jgi:hypothetical protein
VSAGGPSALPVDGARDGVENERVDFDQFLIGTGRL